MQSLEYTSTCTKTPGSKYGRENEGQHHTKSIHTGFTKPCTILLLRHTTNDCTLQTPVNHFYKSCFMLLCINWMPISGCIARNRVSFHHFPYTSSRTSSGSVLRPEHGTHPSPTFSAGTTGGIGSMGPQSDLGFGSRVVRSDKFRLSKSISGQESH